MEISKGRMFATLYKKDMILGKNESLLIMALIIVGNLFLFYKAETTWEPQIAMGLSGAFLSFIPFTIFFKAFNIISSEWKENTVYMMMSLPVNGNMIFLSKLLALLTQLLILVLVAIPFTGTFIFRYGFSIRDLSQVLQLMDGEMISAMLQVFTLLFTGFTLSLVIVFFSTLVGRMFKKFSGVISFVVFLAAHYFIGKITNLLSIGEEIQLVSTGDFIISQGSVLILTIIVFLCTTALYDRKIEL